ncbi:STAS domain-containing protein [Nonomuraea jiangxiensis]|uniref:Anti-sigma factor antagonist n=1 Tax=Nonomuraea jiangxiensis TaxID=633440 RepID=A0A1G9MPG1_9ACTN|nr:STAS domain-containing protein [Nonomuraea jiangxiensis]SDL76182.1 stage II sporulation protein AA (anti-sigma F factor antagonist) [Nonomuraea jiangxiensis]
MITWDSENPPTATLSLTSTNVDDIAVITIDGFLDATTREQFAGLLAQAGPALILDLGGVTFMDSRALGLIVHHWQTTRASGGKFALIGADYSRSKVMWITGLAKHLPLYDTLEDALAALA